MVAMNTEENDGDYSSSRGRGGHGRAATTMVVDLVLKAVVLAITAKNMVIWQGTIPITTEVVDLVEATMENLAIWQEFAPIRVLVVVVEPVVPVHVTHTEKLGTWQGTVTIVEAVAVVEGLAEEVEADMVYNCGGDGHFAREYPSQSNN